MGVVQFYEGKTIFVTGASGYMGKVLIEKLLRSCPGIEKIYVLLRPKRGCSVEDRLEEFRESSIFEVLKKESPDALKKIISVNGDVTELNLGLSESDRKLLVENVNLIFHSAASVRFDDFLDKSIIINVRGTREVAQLALDLKNPTRLVHISTAYSTGRRYVEEQLYPPYANWQEAITLAEECDKELLCIMTQKYINPYPNTYTFAKGLAEHVVNDMCAGKIPAIITRPSIVISALEEPIKGWSDNFNGPVGLMTAGGKGLLRVSLGLDDSILNYIPVDVSIKAIILASYEMTLKKTNAVEVYNITERTMDATHGEFIRLATARCIESPFPNLTWYPRNSITACIYNYYIRVLLFHMLPAMFLDILLRLVGKKPMLVKLQRKIYITNCVLRPFIIQNYVFKNEKMINLQKNLKDDEAAFRYQQHLNTKEIMSYINDCMIGVSLYLLKEPIDPTRQKELKNLRRFWYADIALKTIIFCFFFWLLYFKFSLVEKSINGFDNYFNSL